MNLLEKFLNNSKTAFHACENAAEYLRANGFKELKESEKFKVEKGGKYYVTRNGSAVIALKIGDVNSFNVVASHADSPCFKIKGSPEMKIENYVKLNVERYGGGIFYSWLDTPLTIAGRVIIEQDNRLIARVFTSDHKFVIPSVAIHFSRTVNDGVKLNPQVDMSPVAGLAEAEKSLAKELEKFADGGKVVDYDLYIVSATEPFKAGFSDELLCSPRIDNLTSAFSSLVAIANSDPKEIAVCYIADNEEVGSQTKQGAGSKFLYDVLKRVATALGKENDFDEMLASSFLVSDDNAHAVHPNHPEYSDPTNRVKLGEGIVIKHHANQNYTTDAFSSAIIKKIFDKAGVKYQDFYSRSDMPCGGTLGAISSSQVSIKSVDVGLAQLAMHSAVETMAVKDFEVAVKGLTAFYDSKIIFEADDKIEIKF